METINFTEDIHVLYITALSFPAGVMAAHERLHQLVTPAKDRMLLGISRPEGGIITYRAAAEELRPGEGEQLNCETMVLKKGTYNCITIKDFMRNIPDIEQAFNTLIALPDIDPKGYCVEWYFNDTDIRCMVRIAD